MYTEMAELKCVRRIEVPRKYAELRGPNKPPYKIAAGCACVVCCALAELFGTGTPHTDAERLEVGSSKVIDK